MEDEKRAIRRLVIHVSLWPAIHVIEIRFHSIPHYQGFTASANIYHRHKVLWATLLSLSLSLSIYPYLFSLYHCFSYAANQNKSSLI